LELKFELHCNLCIQTIRKELILYLKNDYYSLLYKAFSIQYRIKYLNTRRQALRCERHKNIETKNSKSEKYIARRFIGGKGVYHAIAIPVFRNES